jgi:hypothetical protein
MKTPILVLAIGITVTLNVWVWLLHNSFIKYLRLAKNPNLMRLPLQKELWEFIESPGYIWLPRIIFSLALIVVLIMIYRVYFS